MKTVTVRHPKAGEGDVPESAVPHWRSLGWEPVDEAAEPEQAEAAHADGQQESKPSGRVRRRSNEESEQ